MPTDAWYPTFSSVPLGDAPWPPSPTDPVSAHPTPPRRRTGPVEVAFHLAGAVVTAMAVIWGLLMQAGVVLSMLFHVDDGVVGPDGQSNIGFLVRVIVFATFVPALVTGLAAIARFHHKVWIGITGATAAVLGSVATLIVFVNWS